MSTSNNTTTNICQGILKNGEKCKYKCKYIGFCGKHKTQNTMDSCCSICLDEYTCDTAFSLSCKHAFHKTCISTWMAKKPSCPVCRLDIEPKLYNDLRIEFPLATTLDSTNQSITNHITILDIIDDWLRMLPEDDFVETIISFEPDLRNIMIDHLISAAEEHSLSDSQFSRYISDIITRIISH